MYGKKRAQIESLVIYCKNNSKKHNNISIEEILSLCFWDSPLIENTIFWLDDDTKFNIIFYVSLRIKIELGTFKEKRIWCKTYWVLHNTFPLLFVIIFLTHSVQCCYNVETSPLICTLNYYTGFFLNYCTVFLQATLD